MPLEVALIGVGGVGKAVLEQLSLPALRPRFRVSVLTNSRYQVVVPVDAAQVDSTELLKLLPPSSSSDAPSSTAHSATKATIHAWSLNELLRELCARALKTSPILVIDCTSDEQLARSYPILLQNGLHIATPNKKAFSGSAQLYESLLSSAAQGHALLYHEASVGAGLPIINTLNDLVATGDKIYKIEGVFSGTLSYIFNSFSKPGAAGSSAPAFSEIVTQAKDAGYTEPHPADDLDGSDVGRKLSILARRLGPAFPSLKEGYASVPTQSLVPDKCQGIKTGGEFVVALKAHDQEFEKKRADAHAKGKVLRYVGSIEVQSGKLECGLQEFEFGHPFAASLGGSDNIISFTSERYSRPLIIQGAGAGGALTAMGVLSDCLRIAERLGC